MERRPTRITRKLVRDYLVDSLALKDLKLCDLQLYPSEDLAVLLMVSQNHFPYEVDLSYHNGKIHLLDMQILIKQNEKPERFEFIGKEIR